MATDDVSFLQEIDDSLRVDNLLRFWQRYGRLVLAACAGVVVLTAADALWKNHLHDVHAAQTSILLKAGALEDDGKYTDAAHTLEGVESSNDAFATLARLQRAEALINAGEGDKALAIYKEAAASGDDALRDLASVQAAILADNHGLKDALSPSLASANDSRHPFNSVTRELSALHLLEAGKRKEARELLGNIAADPSLPRTERRRAAELYDWASESTP